MAVKSVSIRIDAAMLKKIGYVADYEGRPVNRHLLVLTRDAIKAFEEQHGTIDGSVSPAENVKPSRR